MSTGSPKTGVVNLPFDGSMDQRAHPRQVQSPQVLRATNARYGRLGAVDKRPGIDTAVSAFFGGQPFEPGSGKLMTCRDELLFIDGYNIGTLTTAGGNRVINKGKVPEGFSVERPLDTSQYSVSQPDVAVLENGFEIHTWASNERAVTFDIPRYDIFWTVVDPSTGGEAISRGNTVGAADAWQPHVAAAGNNALLFWVSSGSANINCQPWDAANLTWGASFVLVSDGSTVQAAGPQYRVGSNGTDIFLVYQRGTTDVRILRLNAVTGAILSSAVSTESLAPTVALGFGIAPTAGERVWVTYCRVSTTGTLTFRAVAFNAAASAQTIAPFTFYSNAGTNRAGVTSVVRRTATTAVVLISDIDILATDGSTSFAAAPVINTSSAIEGNASVANRIFYWGVPASAPFIDSDSPLRCYAWINTGGASLGPQPPRPPLQFLQWTTTLVDLCSDDTASVAVSYRPITWRSPHFALTAEPSVATVFNTDFGIPVFVPCSAVQTSTGTWIADAMFRLNAATRAGIKTVEAKFPTSSPEKFYAAELGRELMMVPGHVWDGSRMFETAFAHFPQNMTATTAATGGHLKSAKTYAYVVVYEHVDARGFIHRGKPSDPILVTTPAGSDTAKVTLVAPALNITARQVSRLTQTGEEIRVVVYRSGPIDQSDLAFYRIQPDAKLARNDMRNATVTIIDTYADFDYVGAAVNMKQRDTLYTAGGIKPNVQPPGFTSICTYNNRLWASSGNTVYYTKAFVEGEALSFTAEFSLPLDETGDISAMFVIDDTMYISTKDRIYAMQARGPTDANTQGDIDIPSRVVTDRGVLDQRSVVIMPGGAMFQSKVGIQMLDRGRNVAPEPIGSRVQADLATFTEITSAMIHPTGGYVTFCARIPFAGGSGYGGIRLVYDYTTDRWSRDTLMTSSVEQGFAAMSEVESRGVVWSLISNTATAQRLCFERPETYLDNSSGSPIWVTLEIALAEVHPSGLQGYLGFKKWQFLAERFTDHDVNISWYQNYIGAPLETRNIPSGTILTVGPVEQFSQDTADHKGESMRVTFTDATPSSPGAVVGIGRGGAFIGLAIEADPIDNKLFRLPDTNRS